MEEYLNGTPERRKELEKRFPGKSRSANHREGEPGGFTDDEPSLETREEGGKEEYRAREQFWQEMSLERILSRRNATPGAKS